jgi:two-component sensor histidine kinase
MDTPAATSDSAPAPPATLRRLLSWRRLRVALIASIILGLMASLTSQVTPIPVWIARAFTVAIGAVLAFGLCERWPAALPPRLARWVLQLAAIVVATPVGTFIAYWWTTGDFYFLHDQMRQVGFAILCFMGILFGPWIALAAMIRQRDAFAREQALSFQLERSELERQAVDARLRLLQAQVQPHFLFNTLANVRALVRTGSPQAEGVLDSLIAYLRASVPHLDERTTTFAQELQLVRAYLELMHMRMPDRMQFTVHAEPGVEDLRCPPMTLMTLVENAVRHGIDPSEEGGRIDVGVMERQGRCIARVTDTGIGMQATTHGLGTGLSTLKERLQLVFGGDARLTLSVLVPHGVSAEVEFPAQRSPG